MSGPPAFGLRIFTATFGPPAEIRRLAGNTWFEGWAESEDINTADIARLATSDHLRLGFSLRFGPSTAPVEVSGHAVLYGPQEGGLRYRLILRSSLFDHRTSALLHLGFYYDELGSFEDWGVPGSWAVISLAEADRFQSYFSSFNADRS